MNIHTVPWYRESGESTITNNSEPAYVKYRHVFNHYCMYVCMYVCMYACKYIPYLGSKSPKNAPARAIRACLQEIEECIVALLFVCMYVCIYVCMQVHTEPWIVCCHDFVYVCMYVYMYWRTYHTLDQRVQKMTSYFRTSLGIEGMLRYQNYKVNNNLLLKLR